VRELLEIAAGGALPPSEPSDGDVFFDLEGDPFVAPPAGNICSNWSQTMGLVSRNIFAVGR
jgi:hypothetical protein